MALAKLSIDFEARLGQFETELKRISSVADGMASKLSNSFDQVRSAASAVIPVLGGLGAAFTLASFADSIAGTLKFAAALDDMAERTGASVENLSALSGVAKLGGHDLELVEASVIKLNKALHGSDDESKGAAKAIAALGLSIDELRAKDPAEAMLDVANALNKFADGGGKSAAAMAILGKSGAQALPFLKDLAEKGELVGKVTAEQAAQAEQYEKNMNKLSASLSSAAKAMALEMLPALARLSGEMAEGISIAGGFWAALSAGATINPFKNTYENIKSIKAEIADMEREQTEYGYLDEGKYKRKTAQLKMLKAQQIRESLGDNPAANMDANDRKFANKPTLDSLITAPDKKEKALGGGRVAKEKDDYSKIISALNEKIAVEQLNIDTVGRATAAEKEYAKYQADVASGAVKLTDSQKAVAGAYWEVYLARDKQRQFAEGVEKQTEANRLQVMAMEDQIRALDTQAEQYGLTERAINSMTEARLEEAIAIARSKDVDEESIAVLEKELQLRQKLGKSIENRDTSAILSQTEDAKSAKKEAEKALLEKKLAAGDISQRQYEQGMKVIEGEFDTMGEFAKRAAQNMQDAMAEFFIDPTAKGMQSIAESFGKAVQKMIAQAAAAQLGKLLFGDMDKSGNLGGWMGKLFGSFGGGGGGGGAMSASSEVMAQTQLDWMMTPFGFHKGGVVGEGGHAFTRAVPAGVFANARRFHGGGLAGDEVPAILQKGELVLTKEQQKSGRYSDGQRPIVVNVNSSTGDPAEIRRSAAAGARTALGFMSGAGRYG